MQINPSGRLDIKDVMAKTTKSQDIHTFSNDKTLQSRQNGYSKTRILLKTRDEFPNCYPPIYQILKAVSYGSHPPFCKL